MLNPSYLGPTCLSHWQKGEDFVVFGLNLTQDTSVLKVLISPPVKSRSELVLGNPVNNDLCVMKTSLQSLTMPYLYQLRQHSCFYRSILRLHVFHGESRLQRTKA